MDTLSTYGGLLLSGLWMTVKLTVVAVLVACAIALVTGIARSSRYLWVRLLPTLYIEVFRGTSCYVQLFWVFFALPFLGISFDPFTAAVLVLGSNSGSYGSEVVRGAIAGVPRGQTEAAIALNYARWQRFRHIIFPQALVTMIPPAGNLLIDLLKITPLTSLITISDFTYTAMLVRQETGDTLLTFSIILAGYFALASLLAWGTGLLERRTARRGRKAGASA